MNDLDLLTSIVCRPALCKDTEEVFELCSHIWDGGDYIPMVWEEWLGDREGLLGVAEMGGHVVGVFKLTKFAEREWYMEGLRVHPAVQGRGIASHIHNYVVETWRRMGSGIIRLTTGSYNIKIHRMCEKSGFKQIAEFMPYRAPSLQDRKSQFTLLGIEEAQQALDDVLVNLVHAYSWGLINLGWVYANPQLKHIQEAVHARHAWMWKANEGFLSIWEDREDEGKEPGIQLVGCLVDSLEELLVDYRRLMGEAGYQSAGWVAPNNPDILPVLERAGFQRSWDKSLYVYELKLE